MSIFKHICKTAMAAMALAAMPSCGDFLEEVSQDEIKPATTDDMSQLLYKDTYPYQYAYDYYLDLLTDDIDCNGWSEGYASAYLTYLENGAAIYQFNPEMFDGRETMPDDANTWKNLYEKIKGCNVVYDYTDKVRGTDKDKAALKGQALFLRAYYYFKLVQAYCQPYTGQGIDPSQSLGVPLVLSMNVTNDFPARNTLKECYDQIERDFLEASSLIRDNYEPDNVFRVSYAAAEAMLSRFYLYQGEYDKVVSHADVAIARGPKLANLYTFKGSFTTDGIYDDNVSKEAMWKYGSFNNGTYWSKEAYYYGRQPYTISQDLISMYEANDLRAQAYYLTSTDYLTNATYTCIPVKVGYNHTTYGARGIRIAEVYLNRAEAKIRLAISGGVATGLAEALADLNTLRASRFDQGTYVAQATTDPEALLDLCLSERRRELACEEGLRWADIKRLAIPVKHIYKDAEMNETECTLEAGSKLYALPIPYTALERNFNLSQNPR